MSTITAGRSTGGNARLGIARAVRLITMLVVGLIIAGILLVVLEANPSNGIVEVFLDIASFLVDPFKGIFDLDGRKATVAVNWGLAAIVYGVVGMLIARLLAR